GQLPSKSIGHTLHEYTVVSQKHFSENCFALTVRELTTSRCLVGRQNWPMAFPRDGPCSSANREAGTPETKVMNVTKDVYRSYQGTAHDRCSVAKPGRHYRFATRQRQGPLPAKWVVIYLGAQPPNSPDMNVLDLGFFAGLQSLQYRESARSIDELIANVAKAFNDYPLESLDRTFLTLQSCLLAALQVAGDNTYAIPHMSKEKMARRGLLPRNVVCPVAVHDAGRALLSSVDALELERSLAKEIADLQVMNELSYALDWTMPIKKISQLP
ncbi:hypothetical protein As57867_002025, partial [Aphanomyces stellatus]